MQAPPRLTTKYLGLWTHKHFVGFKAQQEARIWQAGSSKTKDLQTFLGLPGIVKTKIWYVGLTKTRD